MKTISWAGSAASAFNPVECHDLMASEVGVVVIKEYLHMPCLKAGQQVDLLWVRDSFFILLCIAYCVEVGVIPDDLPGLGCVNGQCMVNGFPHLGALVLHELQGRELNPAGGVFRQELRIFFSGPCSTHGKTLFFGHKVGNLHGHFGRDPLWALSRWSIRASPRRGWATP